MKYAFIINSGYKDGKLECNTGYSTYIYCLKDCLEKQNHEVVIYSLENLSDNKNNDTLWEYQYYDDKELGIRLDYLTRDHEVIVHDSCLLPKNFVSKREVIRVIHDPTFIDPLYGIKNGRLRYEHEWTIQELYSEEHKGFILKCVRNLTANPEATVLEVPFLHKKVREQLPLAKKLVFPSQTLHCLFQKFFNFNNCQILPHFNTVGDYEIQNNRKGLGIIISWWKSDIQLIIKVLRVLDPSIPKYIFVNKEVLIPDIQSIPNTFIVPGLGYQEFHKFCADKISIVFHPSIIMETFGFIPYEMAKLSIPTILDNNNYSGITEAISFLGLESYSYNSLDDKHYTNKICDIIYNHVTSNSLFVSHNNLRSVEEYVKILLE